MPSSGLNNSTIAGPMASPDKTTTYVVTKKTACNLTTDSVTVTVKDDCYISEIILPNVFTPNNDGINDVFKISSKNIADFNLKIYNRWGILIA